MKVVVNFRFAGLHNWPECPFDDLAFLRSIHRHEFHVCCKKIVSHDDRDIEVICFKGQIEDWLKAQYPSTGNILQLGSTSCEMLCRKLSEKFNLCYCSVLEDGENGAELSFDE